MTATMDNVWKILQEYNFVIDNEFLSDFTCGLCDKIVIDAKQTPCGCKYCKKCIENFLAGGKELCPGKSDYCKEELLESSSLMIDHFTNRKLIKQILKCPIDNCSHECELRLMPEHLLKCGKQLNICPYADFGCNESNLLANELSEHLEINQSSHLLLMVNAINILKNENGILVSENNLIKKDLKNKQEEIDQLKFDLNLTNEKLECSEQNFESKLLSVNQKNIDLNEKINEIEKIESSERIKLEHEINISMNKSFSKLQEFENILDMSINKATNENQLFNSKKETEYIWKISKLSEKLKLATYIFSEAFYSKPKGYKMMLALFFNSLVGIDIYPSIISGEFDKELKFPVMCDITIGIIDEETRLVHRSQSRRIQYAKQPFDPELKFSFPMPDVPKSVWKNDSIIVICFMNVIN